MSKTILNHLQFVAFFLVVNFLNFLPYISLMFLSIFVCFTCLSNFIGYFISNQLSCSFCCFLNNSYRCTLCSIYSCFCCSFCFCLFLLPYVSPNLFTIDQKLYPSKYFLYFGPDEIFIYNIYLVFRVILTLSSVSNCLLF